MIHKVNNAIKNGHLFELLIGEEPYRIFDTYGGGPTAPTNTSAIMNPIKERLYIDLEFRKAFYDSLVRISETPDLAWLVLWYLRKLLVWEKKDQEQKVFSEQKMQSIAIGIIGQKENLFNNPKWVGYLSETGLWGYVEGLVESIHEDYGVALIPEMIYPNKSVE